MIQITLFALIGAYIHAGAAYWIIFTLFCIHKVTIGFYKLLKRSRRKITAERKKERENDGI